MKAALAGVALLACMSSAEARWFPCFAIKAYVATHSRAEVDAMARQYHVTAKEKAAALRCLKVKDD